MPETEDKELHAISTIVQVLNDLDSDTQGRVLSYALQRFKVGGSGTKHSVGNHAGGVSGGEQEFTDFATLFDALNPTTGPMRALAGGYWAQVCEGQDAFDSQSINGHLKNLGHPSKNITADLTALINQKPRLVIQVRKSGKSQQARKTYRLTTEGVRRVRNLLAQEEEHGND